MIFDIWRRSRLKSHFLSKERFSGGNNFKFGIDISDESFYLSLISNPSLYKTTISQFGFVYNPLFLILNGNIFLLRTINFLLPHAKFKT